MEGLANSTVCAAAVPKTDSKCFANFSSGGAFALGVLDAEEAARRFVCSIEGDGAAYQFVADGARPRPFASASPRRSRLGHSPRLVNRLVRRSRRANRAVNESDRAIAPQREARHRSRTRAGAAAKKTTPKKWRANFSAKFQMQAALPSRQRRRTIMSLPSSRRRAVSFCRHCADFRRAVFS